MGSDLLYFANIPSKWISDEGRSFYLVFTGRDPEAVAQDAYQHVRATLTVNDLPPCS